MPNLDPKKLSPLEMEALRALIAQGEDGNVPGVVKRLMKAMDDGGQLNPVAVAVLREYVEKNAHKPEQDFASTYKA